MNFLSYDDTFELLILACLLERNNLMGELMLQPKHFIKPVNKNMFQLFVDMYQKRQTIDMAIMISDNEENSIELMEYCERLINMGCSPANFQFYQEKQEEKFKEYRTKEIWKLYEQNDITYEIMMEKINNIANDFVSMPNNNTLSESDIYDLITKEGNLLKFKRLSHIRNKFKLIENTVNVIAARTSVGKSGLALNFLDDLSESYKCIYFNMEMTEKELYERLVGINSLVSINEFTKLSDADDIEVRRGIRSIVNKKVKIINGSKSIKALRNILTKEARNEHVVAVIDYIGYVTTGKSQNDRERIGEALREIQNMTKDYNITIFVLAQINREGNDAPTLIHLKDSGELEQTAHCCMILHNPDPNPNEMVPVLDLMVLKNRSGRLGKIHIEYNKTTQKFKEVDYIKRN